MKVGSSNVPDIPLVEEIRTLSESGLSFLELYVGRKKTTLDELREEKRTISDLLSSSDLELVGHVTNYPILAWNDQQDLMLGCLDLFAELDAELVTVHPRVESSGKPTHINNVEAFDIWVGTIDRCLERAEEYGIMLCAENINETVSDFVRIFEEFPQLGFTLDIGHANLYTKSNISLMLLENLENRLKHVHCHDNVGGHGQSWDLHLPVGAGNIDFEPIFSKLKNLSYDKKISLEVLAKDRRTYLEVSKERIQEIWNMVETSSPQ